MRAWCCWVLGAVLMLFTSSCRSVGGPGSASFASVTIQGHTVAEIATATARVFAAEGYSAYGSGGSHLVFEKAASRATTISRDGLMAAQSGSRTINRVRVDIVPLSQGSHRLQCEAFMVTGAGDSFFEEEVRLTNVRSVSYQSMLNKVAQQLK